MPDAFRTLSFKIGVMIVAAELIVLFVFGSYYTNRFEKEIDNCFSQLRGKKSP